MLAIDKPEGWTSHDVVAVVRGVLGTRRVGHGGTLDPQATGLLPVLVGPATKFADRIQYAALKVAGRPAYARARGGETVALAARTVQVFRLDVIEIASADLRLLVVCSSETYVRAIARDLGRALGSAAHLARLRRLAVGALEVHEAISPDELRARDREAKALIRPANEDLLTLDRRFLEGSAATIVGAGESA